MQGIQIYINKSTDNQNQDHLLNQEQQVVVAYFCIVSCLLSIIGILVMFIRYLRLEKNLRSIGYKMVLFKIFANFLYIFPALPAFIFFLYSKKLEMAPGDAFLQIFCFLDIFGQFSSHIVIILVMIYISALLSRKIVNINTKKYFISLFIVFTISFIFAIIPALFDIYTQPEIGVQLKCLPRQQQVTKFYNIVDFMLYTAFFIYFIIYLVILIRTRSEYSREDLKIRITLILYPFVCLLLWIPHEISTIESVTSSEILSNSVFIAEISMPMYYLTGFINIFFLNAFALRTDIQDIKLHLLQDSQSQKMSSYKDLQFLNSQQLKFDSIKSQNKISKDTYQEIQLKTSLSTQQVKGLLNKNQEINVENPENNISQNKIKDDTLLDKNQNDEDIKNSNCSIENDYSL